MKTFIKRIAFINIPHIFIEAEKIRRDWEDDVSCIIASGDSPASLVIDAHDKLEAKGIRRGMLLKDCGRGKFVPAVITTDIEYMKKTNRMIMDYLKDYSIIVESSNFGEFYIDLTGTERLFGRVIDTCMRIISRLHEYGFNSRIGVGSNKLTSCLASRITGANSVYEIFDASEEVFLAPVSISYLPEISRELKREILWSYNIQTISDIKAFSKDDLTAMFREDGSVLYDYSRNISSSHLVHREEEKVLKQEAVLTDTDNDDNIIHRKFFQLVLELCIRMRKEKIVPLRFYLQIIYKDDYKFVKRGKLNDRTFIEKRIYNELLPHFEKALERRVCLKKAVLTFSQFQPAVIQTSLFPDEDKDLRLSEAFDNIRDKFGKSAIYFVD